jgi:hypothetical protein
VKNPFKGDEPCTQVDPIMFDMSHSTLKWEVAALRKVCGSCQVREACADYAIAYGLHGFWGGMTETERLRLKKSRRREATNVN